ncbi:MAG: hypothetical protein AAFX04_05350 [Pseudomonadota bacterium]
MKKILAPFVLIFLLVACSALSEGTEKGEQYVSKFHKLYNAQDYDAMYRTASEEYREVTAKDFHKRLFKTLERRLGQVTGKTRTGWRVNAGTGGTIINLAYDTDFALAKGQETFVIRLRDGKAELLSYNVNSPALMIELEEN